MSTGRNALAKDVVVDVHVHVVVDVDGFERIRLSRPDLRLTLFVCFFVIIQINS